MRVRYFYIFLSFPLYTLNRYRISKSNSYFEENYRTIYLFSFFAFIFIDPFQNGIGIRLYDNQYVRRLSVIYRTSNICHIVRVVLSRASKTVLLRIVVRYNTPNCILFCYRRSRNRTA